MQWVQCSNGVWVQSGQEESSHAQLPSCTTDFSRLSCSNELLATSGGLSRERLCLQDLVPANGSSEKQHGKKHRKSTSLKGTPVSAASNPHDARLDAAALAMYPPPGLNLPRRLRAPVIINDLFGQDQSNLVETCKQGKRFRDNLADTEVEDEIPTATTSEERIHYWNGPGKLQTGQSKPRQARRNPARRKQHDQLNLKVFFANVTYLSPAVMNYFVNLKDKHIIGILETRLRGIAAEKARSELAFAGWNSI